MKRETPEQLMFMKNSKLQQKTTNESMTGKTVVVSGSTSGVGLNAMEHLAKAGANIIMVCRNKDKAEPIKARIENEYGVNVNIYIADFSDLNQVRDTALQIKQDIPRIDVLINSVGIHSTKKRFNKDGIEMVFCVNHLSNFLFTYILLDTLKKSAPSRIIHVNSEGHRFGGLRIHNLQWKWRFYTGLRSYGASKTAQLLTTWELADQLKGTGVTINAMHPGAVKTNIGNNNGWLYRFFLRHFTWHFLKDVNISGEALYYLAADKELEGVTGKFFNLTIEELPAKHARNREISKQVYALSMKMTGLQNTTE